MRSAILALVTYAIGLIPFYFLTPVHLALPNLLGFAPATVVARTTATPVASPQSNATPKPRDGADTVSVAAPGPLATTTNKPAVAVPTPKEGDQRYAFLLLGYGGGDHDGAYLTDSMMVVIVDPAQKTLTLLSLPRDIWVPMSFDGSSAVYNKLNTAYAFAQDETLYTDRLPRYSGAQGPGTFTAETVSRLLGVPIRYYLGLDFSGFRQMIDSVGGVDVNVPDSFSARYPANDDPSVDASWMTVRFSAGPQHMTGERAIEYARARETIDNISEGTDFARSRRQRLIMEAFKTRLLQPGGLIHLPQLLSIASQHVDTNYGVPGAAALSQLVLDWKNVKIYQTALTADNYLSEATGPDCTYTLTPAEDNHGLEKFQQFADRLWNDPATGVAIGSTKVVVENDTGVPGVAGQLSTVLASEGYQMGEPTTGSLRTTTTILDRSANGVPLVTKQLQKDLGFDNMTASGEPQSDGDYVVVQLGHDDVTLHGLQSLVPVDPVYSTVGVLKFGTWSSAPCAPPTPTPRPVAPVVDHRDLTPTTPTHATSPTKVGEPGKTETPIPTRTSVLRRGSTPAPKPTKAVVKH
jgi:LCP family protein required for cell wall assembly